MDWLKKKWACSVSFAIGIFQSKNKTPLLRAETNRVTSSSVSANIASLNTIENEVKVEKFDRLIEFVLTHEGRVFENVSGDSGGATKFGISQKSFPLLDIKNLTEQQAKDIYYADYWLPLNCDKYEDKLALAIMDSAVNCGVGTVKPWIADGMTCEYILFKRLRRYADLCQKNPVLNKFLLGWCIRVLHIWERF